MRRAHSGAAIGTVLVILALVALTFAGIQLLSSLTESGDERAITEARLAKAAAALEQFASATGRLPCPAVPTLAEGHAEEGLEKRNGNVCHNDTSEGTIPWRTIGLRAADALDAWGRRISYRVYTGDNSGNGSLTREQGASMVTCDTVEPGTPTIDANRLCPDASVLPHRRSTTPELFLAPVAGWDGTAKGLEVNDFGTPRSDIAFVLISHGASGFGGFSTTGVRRELPGGDERTNTRASGTFVARAFSSADVPPNDNAHFDDVVLFRSLPDLVRNANLSARDWTEDLVVPPFTRDVVAAAIGVDAGTLGANTGRTSIDFGPFTARGFRGGIATNISFAEDGGVGGIGVFGGTNNLMWSSSNDVLRFELEDRFSKFAITLNDFSQLFGFLTERAQITFYNDGTQVGTVVVSACRASPELASFSIDVGGLFNRIDVRPLTTQPTFFNWPTGMLVSEFAACPASTDECKTTLASADPPTTCP